MAYATPGALQKHGAFGDNSEYGAWKITVIPPKAKEAKFKIVVAASLREIVNTYDNVIAAEFLGEGGMVVTTTLTQNEDGIITLTPASPGEVPA
ncbi:MAG: hypothetical protein WC489_07875 [Patescibacteria group bacterium]|jgi:hypothetical protein|nr:hypothetical protein [Methanoregulaceae archaeon]